MKQFTIVLEPDPDGGYTVFVPTLPGCITHGFNESIAVDNASVLIPHFCEDMEYDGDIVPDEGTTDVDLSSCEKGAYTKIVEVNI